MEQNYYNFLNYNSKVKKEEGYQTKPIRQDTYDFEKLLEVREKSGAPYSNLATNGIITYKGITFVCNEKNKQICLGDVSEPKNCLCIPLSKGGSLIVNRDNLGDLSKAIDMFSPEDINLIMRAIAQDTKVQQIQNEIDEEKNSIIKEQS